MYLRRFNSWCFYDFFYSTNADLARNAKVKKKEKSTLTVRNNDNADHSLSLKQTNKVETLNEIN